MQTGTQAPRAPTWLNVRPSLRVGWLKWRSAVRRWPLATATVVLSLIGLGALGRVPIGARALTTLTGSPLAVLTVASGIIAAIILRRRRRLAGARHRDWLAALPSDLSLTARAAIAPLAIWVGVMFIAAEAAIAAHLPLSAPATLMLASAGGYLAAIAIVVLVVAVGTQRARRSRQGVVRQPYEPPPSQYAVVRRVRPHWAAKPRLSPLGYWPVAQTKFQDRPKIRARSLILILLALPLDVPGAVAVAAAGLWLITLHLINLLLAVVRVSFAASWWLAPTPVGALQFTAAVSHRAFAGQIATCALLVGAIYAVGGARVVDVALASAGGWLFMVCLVSATACLLALRTPSLARSVLHRWIR